MRPPPPRYGAAVTSGGSSCPSRSEIDHRHCWCPPGRVYAAQQYASLQRRPRVVDHNNRSELQKDDWWNPQLLRQPEPPPPQQQISPVSPSTRAFCVHCQRCRQQMNDAHYYAAPPNSASVTASTRSSNQRLTSISPPSPMPSSYSAIDCWRPQHASTYNGILILSASLCCRNVS